MHKVSRTILLAGVMAFGTLTAACGDTLELTQVQPFVGVQSVIVSPENASIPVGTTIQLAASVSADASTAKTVTWSSSNSAVATVDQTGTVRGVAPGAVTIRATSTADASKQSAALITVTALPPGPTPPVVPVPTIGINAVTDVFGNPVQLGNANGQLNVTVNTSGGGLIEVFLSTSCTTNTISASDVSVATQQATSAQAGQVTLSFNTAQLTAANAPRFANGNYCIKSRLTNGTQVVVATNTTPITLNNVNSFRSTVTFASQTGGPTSAVSTLNGLNYNQGTLTATISPVIFSSTAPVALVSGYLTRMGQQNGVLNPGNAVFNNVAVTNGVATIVFPDTAGSDPSRSIFGYTSLTTGDSLVITAATDAAGNTIAVPNNAVTTAGFAGLRIDNDSPVLAGAYTVTAPNGFIGAAYQFSSGISGAAATDVKAGVAGVGGVTTTFYIGPVGIAAFNTANSCDITGLSAATSANDLPNTFSTDANRAKVIVRDALGNRVCTDVASTFGPLFFFGVDKIAPSIAFTGASAATLNSQNVGEQAGANIGYRVSRNFFFTFNDTISGFDPSSPLRGTLVRNFNQAFAPDCVFGVVNANATCGEVALPGTIEFTGNTLQTGYYTVAARSIDRAGNLSGIITRTAAYDPTPPTVGAFTQSPNPVSPLGTVTLSAAASDDFDLATSRGSLNYSTAPLPFASVAGTALGATFNPDRVTSATATVALPNVFRGIQNTTAAGVIQANAAGPGATVTVTDVGRNSATSVSAAVAVSSGTNNILVGNTLTINVTNTAPSANIATTNVSVRISGSSSNASFQSQPFALVEIYRVSGGELLLVASNALASVTDTANSVRTFTYTSAGVAVNSSAFGATTTTFYAVGRNAAGDAVISQAVTVTNPIQ